jgi:HTH-type transcriptional regulator / antitoxin HigA
MIATERQLQRARAALADLREALQVEQSEALEDVAPELAGIARVGIQAQINELDASIAQFEALRTGSLHSLKLTTLLDVPDMLIAARLAAGLNQNELAERLGVSPQQVQKDEAGDYERATIERLHSVAAMLDVRMDGYALLPSRGSIKPIPSRAELIGLAPTGAAATRR